MKKQVYLPDKTIKNAMIVFVTNRKKQIILSCKNCSSGVTPKGTEYHSVGNILISFCYIFLFLVTQSIVDRYTLVELSHSIKSIIATLLAIVCSIPMIPICIFISFRFSEWIPAK